MRRLLSLLLCAALVCAVIPKPAVACDESECDTVYDDCFANEMDLVLDLSIAANCIVVGLIFTWVGGGICAIAGVLVSHYFDDGTDQYCEDKESECLERVWQECEEEGIC